MECNKRKDFPKGSTFTSRTFHVTGCNEPHECDDDYVAQCGAAYKWKSCSNLHIWICNDCRKNIPSGSTIQRSPVPTSCKNLLSFDPGDQMKFKNCNHIAKKKITATCGTSIIGNDCTNTDHVIQCTTCFRCTNTIVVTAANEGSFSPDCSEKHIFGPGTFKCGEQINISECPQNHFIKCQNCGGQFDPTTTSTPKIKSSDTEEILRKENIIHNKTLDDLADTHEKLKKVIIDDDDDKPDDIINNDNCINRKHEFESRAKRILAAPARKFLQAYDTFIMQFDPNVFGGEIPKDFGDDLLKEVYNTYDIMEEARLKCLEVLTEKDRIENQKYDQYLRDKLAKKCECQRIHNEYFKSKQTLKPQTLIFDTPLKPQNSISQFQQPKVAQPGRNLLDFSEQRLHQPNTNMSHSQTFIPPMQRNPITFNHSSERLPYFKMNDELALVQDFDASKPRSYMAFRAQWQNFELKMTKANRSELDLYYNLLKVVKGSAKNLIQSDYPNQNSYRDAIHLLDKMFFEPTNLLRDMIKKLGRVHKMTDSYDSLLQGTISLRQAWNDLNQANLNVEQLKGLLFIATTEKQLSEGSWKIWLDVQNDPRNIDNPNFSFDINHYMHAINQAMSNSQKRENAVGKSINTENKFKPKSTLYGSYSTNPVDKETNSVDKKQYTQAHVNGMCVFGCGLAQHKFQLYCPKLRTLKPEQIESIMKKHFINCYLCLGTKHGTKFCESFKIGRLKRCSIIEQNREKCNRMHCRFLHRYKNPPISNLTTTSTELDNTESQCDTVESQN